jgi:hypothetical protein
VKTALTRRGTGTFSLQNGQRICLAFRILWANGFAFGIESSF